MRAFYFVLPVLVLASLEGVQACSSDAPGGPADGGDATTDTEQTPPDSGPKGDGGPSSDSGEFVHGTFDGVAVNFPFVAFAGPTDAGIPGTAQLAAGVNDKMSAPFFFMSFDPVAGTTKCSMTNHDDVDYVISVDKDSGTETNGYGAVISLAGTECSIVITQFGAATGDFVDGTFTATMAQKTDAGFAPETVPGSGAFHVKRTQ